MPFKRPVPSPEPQDGSQSESSTSRSPPSKLLKTEVPAALLDIMVYIVQAKLDTSTISELYCLAEQHTKGVCADVKDADVIITGIGMRRRLERHIPWNIARCKAVLTPQWLRDSVAHDGPLPCHDYVAIPELEDTTMQNCPDCNCKPCACSDDSSLPPSPLSKPGRVSSTLAPSGASTGRKLDTSVHLLPPNPPIVTALDKLNNASRFACQRASPLVCPNQALVRELDVIRQGRLLEGEERSALSYERAASAIKAYPHPIRSLKQVERLPYIGAKIIGLIEEFLESGKISEAQSIESSVRFKTLTLFTSIYGIGPSTARRLYDLSLRTLEDLEIYYGVERDEGARQSEIIEVEENLRKPGRQRDKGVDDEGLGDSWVRVALGLRQDLLKKIPRAEVEEIGRVVMRELNELETGCVSTIAGGYRRGKPESNDVDIVFTHPDPSKIKGLCKRLVRKLHERELVSHVMHISNFRSHNPLRTHHWDSLEKSLTVFVLPPSSPFYSGTRRRLDLIFAPPEVYWTAVVGWTGSIMFQRDLRQWAKDKLGMKFDSSGITRRYDSKELYPDTEKEVFELLGLEWIEPQWRNADL